MSMRYTLEELRSGAIHPSFPNPTLAEVWAEVRFSPHEGQLWADEWYGDYFRQIDTLLPRMRPIGARGATDFFEGDPWETLPPPGVTYANAAGTIEAQLAPGSLLFRHLERYPSWGAFRGQIAELWQPLAEIVSPRQVDLAGLRYIDLVPWVPGEPVDHWIQRLPVLPADLFDRRQEFTSTYRWVEESIRTKLMVAHAWKPDRTPVLVLDFEFRARETLPIAWPILGGTFDQLHERCWQLFLSLLTERYASHLQEGAEP